TSARRASIVDVIASSPSAPRPRHSSPRLPSTAVISAAPPPGSCACSTSTAPPRSTRRSATHTSAARSAPSPSLTSSTSAGAPTVTNPSCSSRSRMTLACATRSSTPTASTLTTTSPGAALRTAPMSDASLHDRLRALGLSGAADGLDDLVALATQKRWGPVQIFEHIADIEERERSRRGLERRLSRSHLGRYLLDLV